MPEPPPEPPLPDARHPAPLTAPASQEQVVELLTRLYAEDRITEEELESRLARVYRASASQELEAIVADLRPPATAVTATAPPAQLISALLSGQEQRVMGVVPRTLEVRARLGYVELDLSQATFEPGVTELDVRALMGYVQVRFPAGVRVECRGRALAGFFAVKGTPESRPDAPAVVQVSGRATLGFVECHMGAGSAPRLPGKAGPES